jgi:hypothetical protein
MLMVSRPYSVMMFQATAGVLQLSIMMTLAPVSVHPDCCAHCASASQTVFTSFPSTLNLNESGAVASCQILIPLDVV